MSPRRGFTLVELLVSVAVIGILVSLLLPAVQAARGAARRIQCANHLRQLALAAHHYHTNHATFPPGLNQFEFPSPPRYRGTSLFTFLLPYIEQGMIADRWDYAIPLNNTVGGQQSPAAAVLSTFLCPADTIEENPVLAAGYYYGITSYGGNGGTRSFHPDEATCDGIFHTTGPASVPQPYQEPVRLSDIRDGTSQTLLLGERSHRDVHLSSFAARSWAEPIKYLGKWPAIGGRQRIGDVTLSAAAPINFRIPFDFDHRDQATPPALLPGDFAAYEDLRKCAFGSEHPGGAQTAFCDGSTHFLADAMHLDVLRGLSTRAGNEVLPDK